MECYCYLRDIQDLLTDGEIVTSPDSANILQDLFSHLERK